MFEPAQEAILVQAIIDAERGNRGEVRVHVEGESPYEDPMDRAEELFVELGMAETAADTGVLLYVASDDRECAVYAGKGIHAAKEEDFWQEVADGLALGYKREDPIAGFEMALLRIGELLRASVPGEDSAGDELPNMVTTS